MTTNLSAYVQQLRDALTEIAGITYTRTDAYDNGLGEHRSIALAALAEPVPLALHDAQEWIPVSTPPTERGWVLIYRVRCDDVGFHQIARFEVTTGQWFDDEAEKIEGSDLASITHWSRLLKPPTLEAEARKGAAHETGDVLERENKCSS